MEVITRTPFICSATGCIKEALFVCPYCHQEETENHEGRYCSKERDFYEEHLKTMVHYQGRRNKKYASKNIPEADIQEMIHREVILQSFSIKHLEKVNGWKPDDEDHDEV
jgi:hypothetical protein